MTRALASCDTHTSSDDTHDTHSSSYDTYDTHTSCYDTYDTHTSSDDTHTSISEMVQKALAALKKMKNLDSPALLV